MSEHVWCHGPKCHTKQTQDRVRGVQGSKVLRTRKIKQTTWNANNEFSHFCSQGCWNDFAYAHWEEFIRLHPRPQALETPINVSKETVDTPYWGRRVETKIEVDESRQIE